MKITEFEYGFVNYKGKKCQACLIDKKVDKVKLIVYINDKICPYHPMNEIYRNWFEAKDFIIDVEKTNRERDFYKKEIERIKNLENYF